MSVQKPRHYVTIFIIVMFAINSYSQSENDRTFRNYQTQFFKNQEELNNPEIRSVRNLLDRKILNNNSRSQSSGTVPVVFHIIQTSESSAISNEMVNEQINILNQDFDRSMENQEFKHPADTKEGFNKIASKVELQFCLAKTADSGQEINGISIHQTEILNWDNLQDVKSSAFGGVDPIDPTHILNIWIVDLPKGEAGFAQMPGGNELTDGIVISSDFFGINELKGYGKGKTLTHLVGSFLGLYELWNDYERCKDDEVDDTPIHNAPNYSLVNYKHLTTCEGNAVELIMNYMDNSDDDHLTMFTHGQKDRIWNFLATDGPRYSYIHNNVQCNEP